MAEQGCKTPQQMLFYMNLAAKDLYGKADLKAFLESEEASDKTTEEKTNSLYVIHTAAVASCNAAAAELEELEKEDSPISYLLTKKSEDIKNLGADFFKTLSGIESTVGAVRTQVKGQLEGQLGNVKGQLGNVKGQLGNVKGQLGKYFKNEGGGRKTKKSKGKKNSSKKNKPKK